MHLERVKNALEEIGCIGKDPEGGVSRVFGSEFIEAGQMRLQQYFESANLKSWIDSVGNVHGVLECGNPSAQEILIGSHYDTVKQGGLFDGLMGVVAGVEVARELQKQNVELNRNIHIIATNGEEGNDLGGTFGSRAMMGLLNLSDENYLEKAKEFGYSKEDLESAILDVDKAICYLELHIEQGPTLDKYGEQIGVVTGIVGLRRYKVVVHGISNHARTTMMEDRDDAMVSAAKVITMADQLARELGNHFVETIGKLEVFPGTVATIPNRVEMVMEIRNEEETLMDCFIQEFMERLQGIAKADVSPIVAKAPVKCSGKIAKMVERVCDEDSLRYRIMPSGATHDGNAMATKMPVGMIFVPSVKGISHAKEEQTEWDDIYTGISVLYKVVKEMTEREGSLC